LTQSRDCSNEAQSAEAVGADLRIKTDWPTSLASMKALFKQPRGRHGGMHCAYRVH